MYVVPASATGSDAIPVFLPIKDSSHSSTTKPPSPRSPFLSESANGGSTLTLSQRMRKEAVVDDPSARDALSSFVPDFSLMEKNHPPEENVRDDESALETIKGRKKDGDKMETKTCMPGGFFWRSKGSRKVSCADVASVGGASDALVSVSSKVRMSGRDLHESAKVSLNAGEFKKALSMFESLLHAQVDRFGAMHPSVGAAIHNVAVVHLRMGQNDLAESLFMEAVSIRKETLGCESLEVAASLSKLGSTRVAMNKFDEALRDLRSAHKIACGKVGTKHKTVAQTLCNIAYLYFQAGELLAAQSTFQDSLDIYRQVWDKDASKDANMAQLTDTLCNIGSIQNKRKNYQEAILSFSEALDLQRKLLGHDHPRVIATLDNLGFSYSKNRDYSSSLQCYKELLGCQISNSGTFSESCCDTLKKLIMMYEKLKNMQGAIQETQEAIRLQQTMLPPDSPIVAQTKKLLDQLHKKIGKENDNRNLRAIL